MVCLISIKMLLKYFSLVALTVKYEANTKIANKHIENIVKSSNSFLELHRESDLVTDTDSCSNSSATFS